MECLATLQEDSPFRSPANMQAFLKRVLTEGGLYMRLFIFSPARVQAAISLASRNSNTLRLTELETIVYQSFGSVLEDLDRAKEDYTTGTWSNLVLINDKEA